MLAVPRGAIPLLVAASVFGLTRASRGDCGPALVSSCINDDNFWPHAGPSHFLAIGSTETVWKGHVSFGVVTTYLSRPVILTLPTPGPGGSDAYAINDQVNGNFLWAYGVTNRLQLDAVLPITFGQGGAGTSPITGAPGPTALQDTAMRDLRFGFAYALLPQVRKDPRALDVVPFTVTARLEISAPTGDKDQFAGERAAVWLPSVAAEFRRGRFFAGGEVGARLRPLSELVGARVGSQAVVALGAGADILPRELLSLAIEARVLPTFAEQHDITPTPGGFVSAPNGKHIAPAEWALSARTAPLMGGDVTFQLAGGGSIPLASDPVITNPRFRFTLGIRYAPLGRDADDDGVPDKEDKCPTVHGAPGGPAGNGCPGDDTRPR